VKRLEIMHVEPIHAVVCRNKSCRSCFSCDFKRFYEYGLNLSTYSELYAAYQYLVPLSVTQVDCERRFLTLKFILRSNIGQEKLEALMLTYMHKQMINDISNEHADHQPVCQQFLSTETAPNAMKTLKSRQ
jgi:hypothetical protein